MRCVGRRAAALFLAAAFSGIVECASADPDGRDDLGFLFFTGTDLWRNGMLAYGGLLWSPDGIDREGFVLKLFAGGGDYRYLSGGLGNAEVTGRNIVGFVMPGWRFQQDRLTVTVFGGLDLQRHRLTPDDPSSSLRGNYAGARGAIDLWYEPDAATMLEANAALSSIGPSYSARAAFGWRAFDHFYAGPEVQGFAFDGNYRQLRAGLHVTAFKTENFEWSGAIGWALDSDHRDGLYGRLGLIARH